MPVPTLVLENGSVMTETAAIALMILDRRPELSPPVGHAERQQFQRLLIWLVANVYPTFTYADYPERWVPDSPAQLKRTALSTVNPLYVAERSAKRRAVRIRGSANTTGRIYCRYAHRGRGMTGFRTTRRILALSLMQFVSIRGYVLY